MSRKTFLALTAVVIVAMAIAAAMRLAKRSSGAPVDAALRAALEKYLAQRSGLNPAGMDIVMQNVKAEGDHAEAQVEFRAKQGNAQMQMTYQFIRQGDEWVVQGSSGTSGSGHPPIPAGTAPSQPESRPPGHPPVHGGGNPPSTKN